MYGYHLLECVIYVCLWAKNEKVISFEKKEKHLGCNFEWEKDRMSKFHWCVLYQKKKKIIAHIISSHIEIRRQTYRRTLHIHKNKPFLPLAVLSKSVGWTISNNLPQKLSSIKSINRCIIVFFVIIRSVNFAHNFQLWLIWYKNKRHFH